MPGLVPGIHVLLDVKDLTGKDVDGRDEPGHDVRRVLASLKMRASLVSAPARGEGRARSRYFGAIDLNFSRSRMFILKPPGITTSPGF